MSGSPMDPVHREVLDLHHSRLVTSLRAADVMERLLTEGAIGKYDYDQLKRTEAQGPRAVNRLLLLTLRRRGGNSYVALNRALRDTDQTALSDLMLSSDLDLRHGMTTERMDRALLACSLPGLNGLQPPSDDLHVISADRHHLADDFPSPILTKATSPALRNTNTPRREPLSSRQDDTPAFSPTPGTTYTTSPSPPTPPRDVSKDSKDEELQQLRQEVQELRNSHSKMESQLQQLEKVKAVGEGQKKSGGCAVM